MLFRKTTKIIRQYRFDRVRNLKFAPFKEINNILEFYAKKYYGVTISDVSKKYFEE